MISLFYRVLVFAVLLISAEMMRDIPSAAATERFARLATVLVYHRFGEDHIPSTNTPRADFEAHLKTLKDEGWQVVSASDLLAALAGTHTLPERAVVITIDDAYRSTYEVAWPLLRAYGYPFTLAVATEPSEQGLRGYMTWDEIREMAEDPLVSFAHHSHGHGHLVNATPEERRADLAEASGIWQRELGMVPRFYVYPYGEYTKPYQAEIESAGFEAAFAQHSGTVWGGSDAFALTRYAMSGTHTSVARLKLALNSQPLGVVSFAPADPFLEDNPPMVRMTIAPEIGDLSGLACYLGGGAVATEQVGREVRIPLSTPLALGRSRLNCTLALGGGAWRWYGALFYLPGADD